MRAHKPTMSLTTSTSDGIDSSPNTIARRKPERDIIIRGALLPWAWWLQIQSWRTDPKTQKKDEDDTYRHLFKSLRSKTRYSANQLAIIPTAQIVAVGVSQHWQLNRNNSKWCWATRGGHNWRRDRQTRCVIAGQTIWHSHSNTTDCVPNPRPHESKSSQTKLLKLQDVQTMSLSPSNITRQNLGQHSFQDDRLKAK